MMPREDEYGEVLSPAAAVRETKQMMAQYGFREIKLKGGVLDPETESGRRFSRCAASSAQSSPLRIDPNCAWSVEKSVDGGQGSQR